MEKIWNIGILGCGDFLRWQKDSILNSHNVAVQKLYDPDCIRAEKFARKMGGLAVSHEDEIFEDTEIDIVFLFVPPHLRLHLVKKAVNSGKHIITTKPIAPNLEEAMEIRDIIGDKVTCGVIYLRTGDAFLNCARDLFSDGELGKLSLYRQDWLHHYPSWNTWALDPAKNGGRLWML